MNPKGLFVGLTTVDLQYLVDGFPEMNSKMNARRFGLSTGGPATNAAVAFAHLGGRSNLYSAIGRHVFTDFMRKELQEYGVDVVDLSPGSNDLPTFSSIMTMEGSGERSVVTYTAGKAAGAASASARSEMPAINVADFDIVMLDGFQMQTARLIAAKARGKGIPVVLDGGSWKEGMGSLLAVVDVAICSADFRPPGSDAGSGPREILDYLVASGARYAAITRGEQAILFYDGASYGEIAVEPVQVVDTLGAGDIFHGAFCFHYAELNDFRAALGEAGRVAGRSCGFLGTREWMDAENN